MSKLITGHSFVLEYCGRKFRNVTNEQLDDNSDDFQSLDDGTPVADPIDWCDEENGTLVTSILELPDPFGDNLDHMPIIDLDGPHAYVASTTGGHGHLYVNQAVSFDGLVEILTVLAKYGIVQDGYLRATQARGYSAARVPGFTKAKP